VLGEAQTHKNAIHGMFLPLRLATMAYVMAEEIMSSRYALPRPRNGQRKKVETAREKRCATLGRLPGSRTKMLASGNETMREKMSCVRVS